MKKKLFICLIISLLFFNLKAQSYTVLENGMEHVTVQFSVGNITSESVMTEKGTFSRISLPDCHLSSEVGNPQIPVIVKMLEIPLCDNVTYTVTYNYHEYSAAELGVQNPVFPAQPSYSKSYIGPIDLIKNENTYQTDAFYGRELVQIEKSGVLRNMNIATLYVSPVKYNPVTNRFGVYDNIMITVLYENADIPATYEMKTLHGNGIFNGLHSRVINPIPPMHREIVNNAPIKYLIVAHSMFHGQLDEFVAWKKRKGYLVEEAYTDDANVGTTTTSIANFIKSHYTDATPDNPAPTYVLLVGDVAQIPAFTGQSQSDHVTDLYYCTWTDGDHFPDCYFGRFSAQNINQLTPQLEKTLQYEKYTMPDPTYLDKAVLVAGSDANWSPTHANGQINYLSQNYINTAYGYSTVHTHLYNSSSQAATIRAEIGEGVGYANYTAHCGSEGWSDPVFETSHIPAMNNADKYGLIVGNCCLSNKFDDNECFGEAMLRTAQKGAVGYIGGSNSTLWNEDFYWSVGVRSNITANNTYDAAHLGAYDKLFHTHSEDYSDWFTSNGSMIVGGNLSVEASTSSDKFYYWEIYHLMGDPSVSAWLTQAETMTVVADAAMVAGATTLNVQAVPYAYVALTHNGDLIAATFADGNGAAVLNFNALTPAPDYELTASAQNYQTYFVTIPVIVPEGSYVTALNPRLSENNEANYGAYINWDVTLKNLGVAGATDVSAVITTDCADLTLVNDSVYLGNMAQNAEQELSQVFSAQINHLIVDETVARQTITVHFDGNQTTTTTFNTTLKAPKFRNTIVQYIEAVGDNDGSIAPGETCHITITTQNYGHADAFNVYSTLSSAYQGVTIQNDNQNIADITAQGASQTTFPVLIDAGVPDPFIIPFIHHIYAGQYVYTDTLYLFVGKAIEDFETGDFSKFDWNNGTNAWQIANNGAFEGTYCASSKSGISYQQSSILQITVNAAVNDTISFYRKLTGADDWFTSNFRFYIDNDVVSDITDNVNWERVAFPISSGSHTLKFELYNGAYWGSAPIASIDYVKFPMSGDMAPIFIEENAQNSLHIFPNPAVDNVTMSFPNQNNQTYRLGVFDMNGKLLISKEISFSNRDYVLNISSLSTGFYVISLFNDKEVYTKKLIVNAAAK